MAVAVQAALNIGAAVGPALGGLALGAELGYRSPLVVSAVLVAVALVLAGAARFGGIVGGREEGAATGRRPVEPAAEECP